MKPYYEHNGITIYHGDCRDVLPAVGRVDLVLTDPPYGIGMAANPIRQRYEKSDWDTCTPPEEVLHTLRFLSRFQIIWGGNYFNLPPRKGFLVWNKVQPEDFTLAMAEQAWTNIDRPAKMFTMRVVGYVKEHPTEKPVELMHWCIAQAPDDVALILDPYMGSGTTLVAAKNLGRSAIGVEKNITGSKQVRINLNDGSFYAQYVVNCKGQEGEQSAHGDVQLSKHFSTLAGVQRWATRLLA